MHRLFLTCLGVLTLVIAASTGTYVRAGHWEGSVVDVLNSSFQTTACHDDPDFFQTIYGWVRSCSGGHDIANNYSSANVYLRGYVWPNPPNSATMAGLRQNPVYRDSTCPSQQQAEGTEYSNAFTIAVLTGKAGIGFHHMSNYHYAYDPTVPTTVPNGAHVGEQANWGVWVYYCPTGKLASKGPHIHAEAGTDGSPDDSYLSDVWMLNNGVPFVHYHHPH